MNAVTKTIVNVLMLILLVSCKSTNIYFDINTQSIVSCNQRKLKNILIQCDSSNVIFNDCFYTLSSRDAPSRFFIMDIYKIYNIDDDTIFHRNNAYKITFDGGGDDGATDLKVWFDNNDRVYKTDKPDCN